MNQTLNQSQIVEIIITTINKIFNNIFSSINNSMFSKLDDFAFIDIKILDNKYIKSFIGDFSGGGKIIYLTDALLIAIALYFIIKYFFSAFSGVQTERPFQFIFKLFVGFTPANKIPIPVPDVEPEYLKLNVLFDVILLFV